MNDGFLLAGCVFDFLIASGFIYCSEWKHETRERYYTVSFLLNRPRVSTVSFEVIVSGGHHKITKSSIRFLEKKYSKNFDAIFAKCIVP